MTPQAWFASVSAALAAVGTAVAVTHETHKGCAREPKPLRGVLEGAAVGVGAGLVVAAVAAAVSGKDAALAASAATVIGAALGAGAGYAMSEGYPFPSHRGTGRSA